MPGTRRVVDWMPERDLLAAANRGLTYDEIADLNYRKTGDRPTRFAIQKYLKRLGAEPRQVRTGELMPWKPIELKHYQSPVRYMLNALAVWREKGEEGSSHDTFKKVRELLEILDGSADREYPRMRLVVDYDPENGWCFRPREDTDEDVVRKPRTPLNMVEYLGRTPGLNEGQRAELISLAQVIQKSQPVPKRAQRGIVDQWAKTRQGTTKTG